MAVKTYYGEMTVTGTAKVGSGYMTDNAKWTLQSVKYSGTKPPTGATYQGIEISYSGAGIRKYVNGDYGKTSERQINAGFVTWGSVTMRTTVGYKYPKENESYGSLNNLSGGLSGATSTLLSYCRSQNKTIKAGFDLASDEQVACFSKTSFKVSLTVSFSWQAGTLTSPTVSVDSVSKYADEPVTLTISDPNKQNMSNGSAATNFTIKYRRYFYDSPTVYTEGDVQGTYTISTTSSNNTDRKWVFKITPQWELGICYKFGSALVNTPDSALNSQTAWSAEVQRMATVTTPLNLTIISEARGNNCRLQWYNSRPTGADEEDLWYRISVTVDGETMYRYKQHDPLQNESQTYTVSNLGEMFDYDGQPASITVSGGVPHTMIYRSAESNSVTFTYVSHSRVGYYGHEGENSDAWHMCTLRYYKTPAYLSKSVVEDFMDYNYRSSLDLKTRPIVSVDDLDNKAWDMYADYDDDQTLLTTYFQHQFTQTLHGQTITTYSILVLTPILEDGSVLSFSQLHSRSEVLRQLGSTDPANYDSVNYQYHVVVDWLGDISSDEFNAKFAEVQQYTELLNRLQRIYYFEAPAAAAEAKQAALDDGLSTIEAELAARRAEEGYYAAQTDLLEWMIEMDRNQAISGWVSVIPYRWNGNSWVSCTM